MVNMVLPYDLLYDMMTGYMLVLLYMQTYVNILKQITGNYIVS